MVAPCGLRAWVIRVNGLGRFTCIEHVPLSGDALLGMRAWSPVLGCVGVGAHTDILPLAVAVVGVYSSDR